MISGNYNIPLSKICRTGLSGSVRSVFSVSGNSKTTGVHRITREIYLHVTDWLKEKENARIRDVKIV